MGRQLYRQGWAGSMRSYSPLSIFFIASHLRWQEASVHCPSSLSGVFFSPTVHCNSYLPNILPIITLLPMVYLGPLSWPLTHTATCQTSCHRCPIIMSNPTDSKPIFHWSVSHYLTYLSKSIPISSTEILQLIVTQIPRTPFLCSQQQTAKSCWVSL